MAWYIRNTWIEDEMNRKIPLDVETRWLSKLHSLKVMIECFADLQQIKRTKTAELTNVIKYKCVLLICIFRN